MTVSLKWRRALLAGATVPALVFPLAACGLGEETGDAGESSAEMSEDAEADQGSDQEAGSGAGSGADELSHSELLASLDLSDAPVDFNPTEPGTELDTGTPAYLVTRPDTAGDADDGDSEDGEDGEDGEDAAEAPLQFWKVTARDSEDIDADEIPLTGDGSEDVDHFVCFTYGLEYLGTSAVGDGATEDNDDADDADDADDESDDADAGDTSGPEGPVAAPVLVPADNEGTDANVVEQVDPTVCGLDEDDAVPGELGDIETGTVYTAAAVSYVDKHVRRGINPTGLAFTYDLGQPEEGDDSEDSGDSGNAAEPADTDPDARTEDSAPVHWT